jgi:hypothetical protein
MNLDERLNQCDRALMNDKDMLERYFKDNIKNTLYLIKNYPTKEVWMPKPFRLTGRIPIADSYEDLFRPL